jgi:hypothetical protein
MFYIEWEPKSMQYRVYDENNKMVDYYYYTAKFDENYLKRLKRKYNGE